MTTGTFLYLHAKSRNHEDPYLYKTLVGCNFCSLRPYYCLHEEGSYFDSQKLFLHTPDALYLFSDQA